MVSYLVAARNDTVAVKKVDTVSMDILRVTVTVHFN